MEYMLGIVVMLGGIAVMLFFGLWAVLHVLTDISDEVAAVSANTARVVDELVAELNYGEDGEG